MTNSLPQPDRSLEQNPLPRYSVWSDLEAMRFLEQTRKDFRVVQQKCDRTRWLWLTSTLFLSLVILLLAGGLFVTYTQVQILRTSAPASTVPAP